jgi:hypothetical protein
MLGEVEGYAALCDTVIAIEGKQEHQQRKRTCSVHDLTPASASFNDDLESMDDFAIHRIDSAE